MDILYWVLVILVILILCICGYVYITCPDCRSRFIADDEDWYGW